MCIRDRPWAVPPGRKVRLGPETLVLPAEGDSHGHVSAVRNPALQSVGVGASTDHFERRRARTSLEGRRLGSNSSLWPGGDGRDGGGSSGSLAQMALRMAMPTASPRRGSVSPLTAAVLGRSSSSATSALLHGTPGAFADMAGGDGWRWRGGRVLRAEMRELQASRLAEACTELEAKLWASCMHAFDRSEAAEEARDSDEPSSDEDVLRQLVEADEDDEEESGEGDSDDHDRQGSPSNGTASRMRRATNAARAAARCLPLSVLDNAMSVPLYAVGNVLISRDEQAGANGGGGSVGRVQPMAAEASPLVLARIDSFSGLKGGCVAVLQPSFSLINRTASTLLFAVGRTDAERCSLEHAASLIEAS